MDLWAMFWQKWFPPKDPNVSFAGKTVLVTGATSGLGFEAALKFVQKEASKVVITARTIEKGNVAKKEIEARVGKTGVVEVMELEMGSYDSIKAFGARVEELESLDIAVLNAGVIAKNYEQSKYGYENTLQVNALSTTLLALLLLPKLRASKASEKWTPVLEVVSSLLYRSPTFTGADRSTPMKSLNTAEKFNTQTQYNGSKFLVQCAVKTLAKSTQPVPSQMRDVIITSVCPGGCKSNLADKLVDNFGMRVALAIFTTLFQKSTEEGAREIVSGTVQGVEANGGMWNDDKFQPDGANTSGEAGEKLLKAAWDEMIEALRKDVPEVLKLVG